MSYNLSVFPENAIPTLGIAVGGQTCTGKRSLGQRFILELLTPLGALPLEPNRGCGFLEAVDRGLTEFAAFSAFSQALLVIGPKLQAEDKSTDPPEEQFKSAALTGLAITDEVPVFQILVRSQAGTATTVVIPIDVQPR